MESESAGIAFAFRFEDLGFFVLPGMTRRDQERKHKHPRYTLSSSGSHDDTRETSKKYSNSSGAGP
jgi:hypothetical protein